MESETPFTAGARKQGGSVHEMHRASFSSRVKSKRVKCMLNATYEHAHSPTHTPYSCWLFAVTALWFVCTVDATWRGKHSGCSVMNTQPLHINNKEPHLFAIPEVAYTHIAPRPPPPSFPLCLLIVLSLVAGLEVIDHNGNAWYLGIDCAPRMQISTFVAS